VHAAGHLTNGIGCFDKDINQFILKKGSIFANNVTSSFKSATRRKSFISKHIKTENGQLVLQYDTPLDSLYEASSYIRLIVRATDGTLGKMLREHIK